MTPELFGRDHPAALLRAEIGRVTDGNGGLVFVTGEAGIGKTTLVTEAAEWARQAGALVLSGSCWDSHNAPGYWPWTQVIRALHRHAPPARAAEPGSVELTALLEEGQEADGFLLYDAVTSALVTAAQSRPLVVVLDDLHWADAASLRLLEFAAQHSRFEPLLFIGTYRDVEVEVDPHPLRELMLPLLGRATTLTLTGLDAGAVGAIMARTTGREPAPEVVAEVHLRTGGNPFFVEQTARLWRAGQSVSAIAPGVSDAVRRRLAQLPPQVARLLSDASVLGRRFHRQVLAALVRSPVAQVDRMLDQAVTARLVAADGGGRFAFAHDLVRETLYEAVADAPARHAAVVHAIDHSPALAERVLPADLAGHAHLAGEALEAPKAVAVLRAAARNAGDRFSFEEATTHLRRALERFPPEPSREKILLQLSLGGELHHCGARNPAWAVFEQAAEDARAIEDPELLARVALTVHRQGTAEEKADFKTRLLTEAHRTMVRDVTAHVGGGREIDHLARELAVRVSVLARRDGDDEALGFGLWARHDVIWGPGTAPEREALTREMIEIAHRSGDADLLEYATALLWVALAEQGDPRYLATLEELGETVRQGSRMSAGLDIDRAIIAAMRGRFAEAEELFGRFAAVPEEHEHEHWAFMGVHITWARLLIQGDHERIGELLAGLGPADYPHVDLLAAITAGQRGVAMPVAAEYPRMFESLALRARAVAAAIDGDPAECARMRETLEPLRGQWLVSLYGCDLSGPVALWLGRLAAAVGDTVAARADYGEALRSAEDMGARPWALEARAALAVLAVSEGTPGAAEDVAAVEAEAAELGMAHLTALSTVEAVAGGEFRREGAVWSLGWEGTTVRVPDAKGLHDIHALLGAPGVDVPAVRLLDPAGGETVVAARAMGGDPVLDEEARARYKRRLVELDEAIDRATGLGQDTRAAHLDHERDALLDELRTATGLGGRPRRLGDEAERARKTVTARIRDTLRRLDTQHPPLAAHLREAVSTGAVCRYEGEGGVRWRL
ncbi:LuxR family transcriptional regulator [Phytomonospora endophytica]|nr:AAA family ATPase [Phytomonospora endophytica]GIG70359.1 LuxR family transcriptional regulator [Phytomonospora endophytica]